MANLKRNGTFNQKRSISVAVFELTEAEILDGALVATLPINIAVTNVITTVRTVSGTASANLRVVLAGTTLANNVNVSAAGVKVNAANAYFDTGGDITVSAGGTAPATGSLEVIVAVEYIEFDKTTGEYTN